MKSDFSNELHQCHAVVVQCTCFTHVTNLLWAFFAGRCHVLLLLAVCYGNSCIFWSTVMVSQPVMGLLELLWHFSLLWLSRSCDVYCQLWL